MDIVTRPKRAAKRQPTSMLSGDDAQTDEESLPSSAESDGGESSGDEGSDSSEDDGDEEEEPTQRQPDPKATRHSKRNATSKTVNYSTKHHPQDASLPGHRHKARKLKKQQKVPRRTRTQSPIVEIEALSGSSRLRRAKPIVAEATTNRFTEQVQPRKSSPRKKLRTLAEDRGLGLPKRPTVQRTATETGSDMIQLLDNVAKTTPKTLDTSTKNTDTGTSDEDIVLGNHDNISSENEPSSTSTPGSVAHPIVNHDQGQYQKFFDVPEDYEIEDSGAGLPYFGTPVANALDDDGGFVSMNQDDPFKDDDSTRRHADPPEDPNTKRHDLLNQIIGSPASASGQQDSNFRQNHSQHMIEHSIDHRFSSSTDSMDFNRQNHQSYNPPPSQFDEQFAITETQGDSHNDLETGEGLTMIINGSHPVSSDSRSIERDSIANRDNDLPSRDPSEAELGGLANTNRSTDVGSELHSHEDSVRSDPDTTGGDDVFQESHRGEAVPYAVKSSSTPPTDEAKSVFEEELCSTGVEHELESSVSNRTKGTPKPLLDQAPSMHDETPHKLENTSATNKAEMDEYLTPASLHDPTTSMRRRSEDTATKGMTEYNLDDTILKSFRSSQVKRSNEIIESDPTTVDVDEDRSEA